MVGLNQEMMTQKMAKKWPKMAKKMTKK